MGRQTFIVYVARLLQKMPLAFFRVFEFPLMQSSKTLEPSCNIIILLALPRSGSTLTYQCLIHGVNPAYLSNLGNLLYQLPLIGGYLSKIKCSKHTSNFQSNQGFVDGLCGPAEGLRFWKYWLDNGLDERDSYTLSKEKLNKRNRYLNRVFSILSKPEQPILTGYLGHTLSVKKLKSLYPEAVFIRLNRNPLKNALSIMNCKKSSSKAWFSVFPKECQPNLHNNVHKQVAAQVYWLNRRIDDEIDSQQTINVDYEDLCDAPNKEINRIIKFCNTRGMKLKQLKSLPLTFKYDHEIDYNNTDIKKISVAFDKLEKTNGQLRNSPNKELI